MRKLFTIANMSILKSRKEKAFLAIMIGMALFITFIISLAFGGQTAPQIHIALFDGDNSTLSQEIVAAFEDNEAYNLIVRSDIDHMLNDVRDSRAEVGYAIPNGFAGSLLHGEPLAIEVATLGSSTASVAVNQVIENIVSSHLMAQAITTIAHDKATQIGTTVEAPQIVAEVQGQIEDMPLIATAFSFYGEVPVVEPAGPAPGFSEVAMGMVIQFTMFTVIFSAGDILEERQNKTWSRLLTTPTSPASILGGKILGAFVLGAIQVTILLVLGQYAFGINYGDNLIGVMVIMASFLLAVCGLGLLLASLVRSMGQLQATTPIVVVASSMLGGAFWPLEMVPSYMRVVAKFTPVAWVMEALRDVVLRGNSLAATSGNLFMLLVFSAVFFGIAVTQVRTVD